MRRYLTALVEEAEAVQMPHELELYSSQSVARPRPDATWCLLRVVLWRFRAEELLQLVLLVSGVFMLLLPNGGVAFIRSSALSILTYRI
jgi:hypothetical protein